MEECYELLGPLLQVLQGSCKLYVIELKKGILKPTQMVTLIWFQDRRNDWATQYPAYVVSPDELFIATEPELTPGRTVYIATDEQDRDYFRPMANAYDIVYLDDFKNELGDLNTNFYVFVDQLVAARGKVFFGVFHSTFTGYINRLRGYYSVKEKRDGYQDGIIESYHYAGQKEKNYYRSYRAFSVPA